MLYTTPFQRKYCIKRPVKENYTCNTLSKLFFVCNCNAFKGKCCIRHSLNFFLRIQFPIKENFVSAFEQFFFIQWPFKKNLYSTLFHTTPFQRKFCKQRPFKENFVYKALSKKILYTMPFQRKCCIQRTFQRKFCIRRLFKENVV